MSRDSQLTKHVLPSTLMISLSFSRTGAQSSRDYTGSEVSNITRHLTTQVRSPGIQQYSKAIVPKQGQRGTKKSLQLKCGLRPGNLSWTHPEPSCPLAVPFNPAISLFRLPKHCPLLLFLFFVYSKGRVTVTGLPFTGSLSNDQNDQSWNIMRP